MKRDLIRISMAEGTTHCHGDIVDGDESTDDVSILTCKCMCEYCTGNDLPVVCRGRPEEQ